MAQGSEISLFSGYSGKENRTTNYCLLALKLLYEENPKYLDEALNQLTSGQVSGSIGVSFYQQAKHEHSIPDGVIVQKPLTLFIETKNFDWFYDDQLERHLDGLSKEPGLKVLLALANFEALDEARFERIKQLCKEQYSGKIAFASATFEGFLDALRLSGLPKDLEDLLADLEGYLSQENLLPTWKHKLDVCNCAGDSYSHIPPEHNTYICPAKGGAYSHSRSRYFGMYKDKRVQYVAEIEAVVDVYPGSEGNTELRWRNISSKTKKALQEEGRRKMQEVWPDADWAGRVFVLGPLHETEFWKDSKGGMMGSKQYFDVSSLKVDNAEELAEKLRGKQWSDLPW